MSEPRTIVQISDTHIVRDGMLHDKVDTFVALKAILADIEASPWEPAALVLSGDLSDDGDPETYRKIGELVGAAGEAMGVPTLFMPGNHDDREAFREVLMNGEGEGPIDQTLWVGGLRIIALDTTVPGAHHGELRESQLDALRSQLASPAPEGTIIAIHHPPIFSPVKVANLLSLRESERFAEVLRGADVAMVIAGHTHHASAGLFAGIPIWVSTASAYQADVLADGDTLRGIPGVGFSRIDVIDGAAYATQVAMAIGEEPVYEYNVAGIEAHLASLATSH